MSNKARLTNWAPPPPLPKGRRVITEIPRTDDDKAKTEWHRDIINAPTTYPMIEYVIKEYVFMSFWLNAIYTLYVILFSILYLYMYEKATRYQWFEEK